MKKDDGRKGFFANHLMKWNIRMNMTDPLAMRLNNITECTILTHMAIALAGALYFTALLRDRDSYAFILPLVALAVILGIIAGFMAIRVQRISSSGSADQTEAAYRRGIRYMCVMSAIYVAAVCALLYHLL